MSMSGPQAVGTVWELLFDSVDDSPGVEREGSYSIGVGDHTASWENMASVIPS